MQKYKVMNGKDGSVLWQCKYGIMHITRDVKQSLFKAGQIQQVEDDGKYSSACEGHLELFNSIDSTCVCFFGHNIKYFFDAEESRDAFAVYEG